ncbi:MAG: DUF4932 domain-containing protein [Deltaproteobacteria bacterium]|nr:DUF4932 domain-containing protein [Deltaproteobacteria bacterium]
MRALILCVLVACKGNSASPPPPPSPAPVPGIASSTSLVRVDRRIELLSILHRLIGHRAYTEAPATPYVKAVDATFGPFKNHPAVLATQALRASHSISWDAPLILAVHLDDQLELVNPGELPELDPRFTGADVAAYAATLRDFARDTKLDAFLDANRPYAEQVVATVRQMIQKENPVPWFDAFFGAKPNARFIVVPGLLTGTHNMGVRATLPDGTQEIYQVLGIHAADGMPTTDDASVALLVHEMAHSYVNPLVATHRAAFEASGTRLFALVEDAMKKQAYGAWKTFVDESIVRAVVVVYLLDRKGKDAANAEAQQQLNLSFRWTPVLAKELLRYQSARATYADISAFMPELIKAFAELR